MTESMWHYGSSLSGLKQQLTLQLTQKTNPEDGSIDWVCRQVACTMQQKNSHFRSAVFAHKSSKYTTQENRRNLTNKIFKIHLKGKKVKKKENSLSQQFLQTMFINYGENKE